MQFIPLYFIIAIFITMFVLYLIYPDPVIIVKYPTPDNEFSDVYVDDKDVCYKYRRQRISLEELHNNK